MEIPKKKAINFYRSYYDSLNMLDDKQYVAFNKALTSVMFMDTHIDEIEFEDATLKILWASVSHSLRQSVDGFLSKHKLEYNQALRPPTQGAYQGVQNPPCQQEQEKEQEQEQGKEQEEGQGQGKAELVRVVFNFWKSTLNHKRAKLDGNRKKIIKAALATGYSVDDLKAAIVGCSMSDFHMGINDKSTRYDSLRVIFKDADQIDKFIGIGEQGGARAGKGAEIDAVGNKAISEWLSESNVIDIGEVRA